MSDFSTGLTNAQVERLALLAEECAEVIQIVGKCLRHGLFSYNPNDGEERTPNFKLLSTEIGHVRFAVRLLAEERDINEGVVRTEEERKSHTVLRYLHYQDER